MDIVIITSFAIVHIPPSLLREAVDEAVWIKLMLLKLKGSTHRDSKVSNLFFSEVHKTDMLHSGLKPPICKPVFIFSHTPQLKGMKLYVVLKRSRASILIMLYSKLFKKRKKCCFTDCLIQFNSDFMRGLLFILGMVRYATDLYTSISVWVTMTKGLRESKNVCANILLNQHRWDLAFSGDMLVWWICISLISSYLYSKVMTLTKWNMKKRSWHYVQTYPDRLLLKLFW